MCDDVIKKSDRLENAVKTHFWLRTETGEPMNDEKGL
jgi:hypothetical protein